MAKFTTGVILGVLMCEGLLYFADGAIEKPAIGHLVFQSFLLLLNIFMWYRGSRND